MARSIGGRGYDLVILSDHGMTRSKSYRVEFGESLGATIQRLLDEQALISHSERSEYSDVGAEIVEAVAQATPPRMVRFQRMLRRGRDWLRSRYGLREIIIPEKYRVDVDRDVVATYSSCLALVYWAADAQQLSLDEIRSDEERRRLYDALVQHPGIGVVLTRSDGAVHAESEEGTAKLENGLLTVLTGENPLEQYGTEAYQLRAIESLVLQPNCGDCVLFGTYDGYEIISFDDQIGAHGSAGGDQVYPFLITPPGLLTGDERIEDSRDIHRVVMTKYTT